LGSARDLHELVADMGAKSTRNGANEVVTPGELEELVGRMVNIWIGEMQRKGELRPTATDQELDEFKATVVDSILSLFRTVDGFKESLRAGTRAEVVEIIGRYLQAIS
jgi:hypothetical protein